MAFMGLSGNRLFLTSKFMNELQDYIFSDDGQFDQKRFDKINKILGDMFDLCDLTINIYLSANNNYQSFLA